MITTTVGDTPAPLAMVVGEEFIVVIVFLE
jgi:hypothetical protein